VLPHRIIEIKKIGLDRRYHNVVSPVNKKISLKKAFFTGETLKKFGDVM
jgi:hypothetical protein